MCGASDCESLVQQEEMVERAIEDPFYMPEPFPEEMLEPFEWGHILATLDVCANEATPTKFCDELGNQIMPILMMNVVQNSNGNGILDRGHKQIREGCETMPVMRIREEVSIVDRDPKETAEEIFYDSNDFLEDVEQRETDEKELGSDMEVLDHEKFYDFHNQTPKR